jgi:Tol biopolymer transport system component
MCILQNSRRSWPTVLLVVLLVAGCQPRVREDRHINWSTQTGDVGFQHGEDGVYVAEGDDRRLEKIFDPGEDVVATSSPLWSPVDGRLIFTVARRPEGPETVEMPALPDWDSAPEGREFAKEKVTYTCMLRAAAGEQDEAPPEPEPIFEAACDHVGYVAANLAVRWHPDGKRILFIDRTGEGMHSLFEFDLATRVVKRVLEWSAEALAFDWTPGGTYLACVSAAEERPSKHNGIWIRPRDDDGVWWRVLGSEELIRAGRGSGLKRVRSLRPAWTTDDRRFAYVVRMPGEKEEAPDETSIHVVALPSRKVTEVYRNTLAIRELRWHPDGNRLGFVQQGEKPVLRMVDEKGKLLPAIDTPPIRRFAGWNQSGTRLAYVAPDEVPTHRDTHWAVLFLEVPQPRDQVYVVDGDGEGVGEPVFSGMRVTFPKWSPQEDKLSLWCTYSPTHQSLLSAFSPWALRPGDPAAILDGKSGQMHWMTINDREQAQVGHYHLLKRDYERAWQWYERAADGRAPREPIKWDESSDIGSRLQAHQDVAFFEYYCLSKLGRDDEAQEKLREFRRTMTIDISDVTPEQLLENWTAEDPQQMLGQLRTLVDHAAPLIQDMYAAEVYLSLDAADDGIAFFQRSLDQASSDHAKLSHALVLSQLLLITERHEQYARLVTETVAPIVLKLLEPTDADVAESPGHSESAEEPADRGVAEVREDFGQWCRSNERSVVQFLAMVALNPMFSDKFLATIPEPCLEELVGTWRELRERADDDIERAGADLFLRAALKTLDRTEEQQVVEQRLADNPSLADDFDPDALYETFENIRRLTAFAW